MNIELILLPPNALAPIRVTEFGIDTDLISLCKKAPSPISVTEVGITTEVSFEYKKAKSSMILTLSEIDNSPLQFFPSTATPTGINTEYVAPPPQGNVIVSALAVEMKEFINEKEIKKTSNFFITTSAPFLLYP